MRILIAYYSRGGRTRRVANRLARALAGKHDVQIKELWPRGQVSAIQALTLTRLRRPITIEPLEIEGTIDLVYLGAPIWTAQMHPTVWGYLDQGPIEAPHVLFATSSNGGNERTGMQLLARALAKRRMVVKGVIDVQYPRMTAVKLRQLVQIARI